MAKAVTWRLVATTTTVVIVGIGTGDWRVGAGVGLNKQKTALFGAAFS